MIVIGLTGKAGAGKGVVADYLVQEHGFTKLSFAGPLKKMLRTLDPRMDEFGNRLSNVFHHYGEDELKVKDSLYGPEYRRLLQVLGTDCIRAVDQDFWVRAALAQLTAINGKYVFDDCRFPNEAEAIQFLDPHEHWHPEIALWNIIRPDHDGGAGTHASEQHAGNMGENYHLPNDGTIEDLHAQVDSILASMTAQVPV